MTEDFGKVIVRNDVIEDLNGKTPENILDSKLCHTNIDTLIKQYNVRVGDVLTLEKLQNDLQERMNFAYFVYMSLLWGDITLKDSSPEGLFSLGEKVFELMQKVKKSLVETLGAGKDKTSFMNRIYGIVEKKLASTHNPNLKGQNIKEMYTYIKDKFKGRTRGMYYNGKPMKYTTHLKEVFAKILFYGKNVSPLKLLLALGHDLMEDTHTTLEELRKKFGHSLAFGVGQLTKPSSTTCLTEEYGFDPNDELTKQAEKYILAKEDANKSGTSDEFDEPDNYDSFKHIVKQVKYTRNTEYLLHLHELADKNYLYFDKKTLSREENEKPITYKIWNSNKAKYSRIDTQEILEVKFADVLNNLSTLYGHQDPKDKARKVFEAEYFILPLAQERSPEFAKKIKYWIDIWKKHIDKELSGSSYEDITRKYFEQLPSALKNKVRERGLASQYEMERKIEESKNISPKLKEKLKTIYVDMRLRDFGNILKANELGLAKRDALSAVEKNWNEISRFFYGKDTKRNEKLMIKIGEEMGKILNNDLYNTTDTIDSLFKKLLLSTKGHTIKLAYGIDIINSYHEMLQFQVWKNKVLEISKQDNFGTLQQEVMSTLDKRTYTHDIKRDKLSICMFCHLLNTTDDKKSIMEDIVKNIVSWRLKNPISIMRKMFKEGYFQDIITGGVLKDIFGIQVGWQEHKEGAERVDTFLKIYEDSIYEEPNDRGFVNSEENDDESLDTTYPFINMKMRGEFGKSIELQHVVHPMVELENTFASMVGNKTISQKAGSSHMTIDNKDDFWHTLIARMKHFNQEIYKLPAQTNYAYETIPTTKLIDSNNMQSFLTHHIKEIAKDIFNEVAVHWEKQNKLPSSINENKSKVHFDNMEEYRFYDKEQDAYIPTYRKSDGSVVPFPSVDINITTDKNQHLRIIEQQLTKIANNLLDKFLIDYKDEYEKISEVPEENKKDDLNSFLTILKRNRNNSNNPSLREIEKKISYTVYVKNTLNELCEKAT